MLKLKDQSIYYNSEESLKLKVKQATPAIAVCRVNAEVAAKWLKLNVHNREARSATYSRYAEDMKNGEWLFDGNTIKFDKEGVVQDGQHRLMGIVLADTAFDMIVVFGLPQESFAVQDMGKRRSASEVFKIAGFKGTVSSIAKLCKIYEETQFKSFKATEAKKMNNNRLLRYAADNPTIIEASETILGMLRDAGVSPVKPNIAGSLYWAFKQKDEELAKDFMERLVLGVNLTPGDPLLGLRNRIIDAQRKKMRLNSGVLISALIKAWNNERRGSTLSYIRLEPNYKMEDIS
jgi:hypothetical protein